MIGFQFRAVLPWSRGLRSRPCMFGLESRFKTWSQLPSDLSFAQEYSFLSKAAESLTSSVAVIKSLSVAFSLSFLE